MVRAAQLELHAVAAAVSPRAKHAVEFAGGARVLTPKVAPGGYVRILYMVRRNRPCETSLRQRFWSLAFAGFDPSLERVREAIGGGLERYRESGRLDAGGAEGAGRILWALAYGLVSLRITQPDFEVDDQLAGRALDALFLGLSEMENRGS